jgi:predicted DCC family thiol-disulfide oxidoreductase YuxK
MSKTQDILLVYDKECPACDYYGKLAMIEEITAAGLDIDQGMVLKVGDKLYYGSDALHSLSLMSTRSGVFNRLSYVFFGSKRLSAMIYPVLRSCRNLLLKILGKAKINNLEIPDNDRF